MEHADWPVRLVATRYFVINASVDIVDRALDLSGGGGVFINGKPAARNGDKAVTCNDPNDALAGTVVAAGTVMIG